MLIKIIWTLIGLNSLAFIIVLAKFFQSFAGRNVDAMESGWMTILFSLALLVILLAVLPAIYSKSNFGLYVALFFAALPGLIAAGIFLSNNLPSFKKKEQTLAAFYYKDKKQRLIADAIERSDTVQLKELIKGQDLNIQGNRVWDRDGLNYLQFAVRLRDNAATSFNKKANDAAIRILVEHGSATTPALAEAARHLSPDMIRLLLDAGADPNSSGFTNGASLLFEAISTDKQRNDVAIVLVQKGADVNAINSSGFTPIMVAANNAGTTVPWKDAWRVVRYILEQTKVDYLYMAPDGNNFPAIIKNIKEKAVAEKVHMSPDFDAIVKWLKAHPAPAAQHHK